MAEELSQKFEDRFNEMKLYMEGLNQTQLVNMEEFKNQMKLDMEGLNQTQLVNMEEFKKTVLLDMLEFKQILFKLITVQGLHTSLEEEEGEGSTSSINKVLRNFIADNKVEFTLKEHNGHGELNDHAGNKDESRSEEHNGHGDLDDPSFYYSYSVSPPRYCPDPVNWELEPSPDLPPRLACSPSCFLHPAPSSTTDSDRRSRFSNKMVMELLDATYDGSPEVTNSEHGSASVNKNDLSNVYSEIAPSVVSVSSFLGAVKLIDCSGLIINWNLCENEATVLTSSKLLWSPKDLETEIQLIVRLGDGTLLLAVEDHVDFYHNLLTLKVKSSTELKWVDLRTEQADIGGRMNVTALGRSFYTCSMLDFRGELQFEDPLFGCDELLKYTCNVPMICEGGPLISDAGSVVGMNFFGNCGCGHLLSAPVILNCLEMWRSYSTILRPLLGMGVADVYPVPCDIYERFNISPEHPYVAVKEVYKESLAGINGVRTGDIVATCNGVPVRSAKQYYQLVSETSRAVTACDDSGQQSFNVVLNPYDGRSDSIDIEADIVSVNDTRFHDCWPRVEDNGWSSLKLKLIKSKLKNELKLKGSK